MVENYNMIFKTAKAPPRILSSNLRQIYIANISKSKTKIWLFNNLGGVGDPVAFLELSFSLFMG